TAGPDTDSGDRRSRHLLQSTHVGLGVLRKFLEFPGTGDVLGPAVEVLVHGFGVVELGLCHGDLVVADPVDVVTHAHGDVLATGEHVQLGEEEVGDAVDTCRVAVVGGVVPTGAAGTGGGDDVSATEPEVPIDVGGAQFGR